MLRSNFLRMFTTLQEKQNSAASQAVVFIIGIYYSLILFTFSWAIQILNIATDQIKAFSIMQDIIPSLEFWLDIYIYIQT